MNNTKLFQLTRHGRETNPYPDGGRWSDNFGIEFEVENATKGISEEACHYWTQHNDGSLVNGIEYVLARPMGQENLLRALDLYYASGVKARGGLRTSTHIHINGGDLTVDQLRSMIALMYTLENDLYLMVDENRKWAGYSCGLAEMDPRRLRTLMSDDDSFRFSHQLVANRGGERYYGFNVSALARHGSVEFRYFPGMPNRADLESWLDLVEAVKKAAVANPIEELITRIESEDQLNRFLNEMLPGNIRQGLLSMTSARARWGEFNKIAALAEPDGVPNRQDQLIRIVPQLVHALVKTKRLTPIGGQYLKNIGDQLGVMTLRDFGAHLDKAQNMKGDPDKKQTKKVALRYGDFHVDHVERLEAAIEEAEDAFPPTAAAVANVPQEPPRYRGRGPIRPNFDAQAYIAEHQARLAQMRRNQQAEQRAAQVGGRAAPNLFEYDGVRAWNDLPNMYNVPVGGRR